MSNISDLFKQLGMKESDLTMERQDSKNTLDELSDINSGRVNSELFNSRIRAKSPPRIRRRREIKIKRRNKNQESNNEMNISPIYSKKRARSRNSSELSKELEEIDKKMGVSGNSSEEELEQINKKNKLKGGKRRRRRKTRKKQRGGYKMKETIVKFKKGPFPKKYTAIVKNIKSKKTRKIHFGDRRYQQYKDRTPLKLYAKNNHNTRKRMQNYFNRHSGTKKRGKAIKKEKRKSGGKYNAKILSHIYLW